MVGDGRAMRRYVTQVRVRWSDLDAFRHVNNAKTVTLLEEARVDWLFSEAARHGVNRLTEGIVVAKLEIEYKRPIGMELPVTVSMGVTGSATRLSPSTTCSARQGRRRPPRFRAGPGGSGDVPAAPDGRAGAFVPGPYLNPVPAKDGVAAWPG